MHLQRVQVPDFRVLKDVDITFEHDFNPRVFPLGSQNGGGKSTLLQLIFTLLHCSTNPERLPALKNLLSGFSLREGEDERILAIIDVWDGEKIVQLKFFVCSDLSVDLILDSLKYEDNSDTGYYNFIHKLSEIETIRKEISEFPNQEQVLNNIVEQLEIRNRDISSSNKLTGREERRLSRLGIDLSSIDLDLLNIETLEKEARLQLSTRHLEFVFKEKILTDKIDEILEELGKDSIEYITIYSPEDSFSKARILLCKIRNIDIGISGEFLNKLSNKIFLAAPPTQVFLFLSREIKKSLFTNKNDYQFDLISINSTLLGLFTYDFLSTDILIKSFANARDKDFKEALKTGEYGKNYKKLLKDLDFLMHDKQINLTDDFSSLTFKLNRFGNSVELYPEDLSHGELKRLSIYVWLKYYNIEDAIVLMDEVDLALHPDWQYQIASDLVEWEPSNQYILATHSYELCQALTPSHVKVLEPKLTERISD